MSHANRKPLFSLALVGFCLACSSGSNGGPSATNVAGAPGAAGSTNNVPTAGAATGGSSQGGSGGSDAGGMSQAGGTGGAAGAATQGGSAGESTAGSGGSSAEEPTNFTCTQVTGAMITGEWFDGGGFEDKLAALGGDPEKWEIKNNHFGTIEKWVNPTEGPIQTNDGDSYYWGKEPGSACAANSNFAADRVIFTAISWELTEEAQWVEALEAVVQNIKDKYPNIRWIELVSQMRCPGNTMCNDNAVQGPGSDAQASLQDCYVWPAQDAAMAAVADADPIVGLAPKFEAQTCRPEGIDGAHLGSANDGVAQAVADWYAEHP